MIPEHPCQTNSVPISSRATVRKSRRKKSGVRKGILWKRTSEPGRVIDELPRQAELLLKVLSESFDAEGLSGVVTAVEDVDAQFLGEGVAPVRTFARDEGVHPGLRG